MLVSMLGFYGIWGIYKSKKLSYFHFKKIVLNSEKIYCVLVVTKYMEATLCNFHLKPRHLQFSDTIRDTIQCASSVWEFRSKHFAGSLYTR